MRLIDADAILLDKSKYKKVEDVLKALRQATVFVPPPYPINPPLTPEMLQEMDGEPMWIGAEEVNRYDIFCGVSTDGIACFFKSALPLDNYGRTWLAYRMKPEEGVI